MERKYKFGVSVRNHKSISVVLYFGEPFKRFKGSRHEQKAESYAKYMEDKLKLNRRYFRMGAEDSIDRPKWGRRLMRKANVEDDGEIYHVVDNGHIAILANKNYKNEKLNRLLKNIRYTEDDVYATLKKRDISFKDYDFYDIKSNFGSSTPAVKINQTSYNAKYLQDMLRKLRANTEIRFSSQPKMPLMMEFNYGGEDYLMFLAPMVKFDDEGNQILVEDSVEDLLIRKPKMEQDPDFDPEKADRNKDGELSDWEKAVGNAVAKGIREHKDKKGAEEEEDMVHCNHCSEIVGNEKEIYDDETVDYEMANGELVCVPCYKIWMKEYENDLDPNYSPFYAEDSELFAPLHCRDCEGTGGLYDSYFGIDDECPSCEGTGVMEAENFENLNPKCIFMISEKEASWVGWPFKNGKGQTDCKDLGYDMCESCIDFYAKNDSQEAESFEASTGVMDIDSYDIDYFDLKEKLNKKIIDARFDIVGEVGRFYLTEYEDSEIREGHVKGFFMIILDNLPYEDALDKQSEIRKEVNNVLRTFGFDGYSLDTIDEGLDETETVVLISKKQKEAESFEAQTVFTPSQVEDNKEWNERSKRGEFWKDLWWKKEGDRYSNHDNPNLYWNPNSPLANELTEQKERFFKNSILPSKERPKPLETQEEKRAYRNLPPKEKNQIQTLGMYWSNVDYLKEGYGISEELAEILESSKMFGMYMNQMINPQMIKKYRTKILKALDSYNPKNPKETHITTTLSSHMKTRPVKGPRPAYDGNSSKPGLGYYYSDYYDLPVPFMGYDYEDLSRFEAETFESDSNNPSAESYQIIISDGDKVGYNIIKALDNDMIYWELIEGRIRIPKGEEVGYYIIDKLNRAGVDYMVVQRAETFEAPNPNCSICDGKGWKPSYGDPKQDAYLAKLFGVSIDELRLTPCDCRGAENFEAEFDWDEPAYAIDWRGDGNNNGLIYGIEYEDISTDNDWFATKDERDEALHEFLRGFEGWDAETFEAEIKPTSYMVKSDAHKLKEASKRIHEQVELGEEYPEWWKSKLSVARNNTDNLADFLDYAVVENIFESEGDHDHEEIDELIDKLNTVVDFAITFIHDGGYGGEPKGVIIDDELGIKTEIVHYVEGSIQLHLVRDMETNELLSVRFSLTGDPEETPIVYLPLPEEITSVPEDDRVSATN